MTADTLTDLEACVAEQHAIVSRIRQLEHEGSVRASYIEKLQWQLRGLDAWIDTYTRCIASDRGGCLGYDHDAVLMDRTFEALEGQSPLVVAAAVAQPRGDRDCPSNALRLVKPLEPDYD